MNPRLANQAFHDVQDPWSMYNLAAFRSHEQQLVRAIRQRLQRKGRALLPLRCVLTVTYIPLVLLFDWPQPVREHFTLKPTAYGIVWITVLATLPFHEERGEFCGPIPGHRAQALCVHRVFETAPYGGACPLPR